jgi:hypothetical protein
MKDWTLYRTLEKLEAATTDCLAAVKLALERRKAGR